MNIFSNKIPFICIERNFLNAILVFTQAEKGSGISSPIAHSGFMLLFEYIVSTYLPLLDG